MKKEKKQSILVGREFFSLLVFAILTDLKSPYSDTSSKGLIYPIYFLIRWIKHKPDVLLWAPGSTRYMNIKIGSYILKREKKHSETWNQSK